MLLSLGALSGALRQLDSVRTPWQAVETGVQLLCGLLGAAVVLARLYRPRRVRLVHAFWAVSLVATAGLSALVWGPAMPWIALLFALTAAGTALGLGWMIAPP